MADDLFDQDTVAVEAGLGGLGVEAVFEVVDMDVEAVEGDLAVVDGDSEGGLEEATRLGDGDGDVFVAAPGEERVSAVSWAETVAAKAGGARQRERAARVMRKRIKAGLLCVGGNAYVMGVPAGRLARQA